MSKFWFYPLMILILSAGPVRADIMSTAPGYDRPIIHFKTTDHGKHYTIEICSKDYKYCEADPNYNNVPWEKTNLLNQSQSLQTTGAHQRWLTAGIIVPAAIAAGLVAMGTAPEDVVAGAGAAVVEEGSAAIGLAARIPGVVKAFRAASSIVKTVGGKPLRAVTHHFGNFVKGDLKTIAWLGVGASTAVGAMIYTLDWKNANDTNNAVVLGNHAGYFINPKAISGCVVSNSNAEDLLKWMNAVLAAIPNHNKPAGSN